MTRGQEGEVEREAHLAQRDRRVARSSRRGSSRGPCSAMMANRARWPRASASGPKITPRHATPRMAKTSARRASWWRRSGGGGSGARDGLEVSSIGDPGWIVAEPSEIVVHRGRDSTPVGMFRRPEDFCARRGGGRPGRKDHAGSKRAGERVFTGAPAIARGRIVERDEEAHLEAIPLRAEAGLGERAIPGVLHGDRARARAVGCGWPPRRSRPRTRARQRSTEQEWNARQRSGRAS